MKNLFNAKIKARLTIIDQPWLYPIILLFVGLCAYGIIFTRPGFFWDDWTFVFFYKLNQSFLSSIHYLPSRPFTGWLYLTLFTFTKMTPIAWELLAFILRWLGILFIYFTLNAVWPHRVWQHRWVGALMLVYPGFLSQPVSVAFSQHLSTFLFFTSSLFLTVMAIKHRRFFWLWMPLSVMLGVAQMFITEFFVTLEVIRLLIIWFTLRSLQVEKKTALRKTILYWLPFALGLGAFFWERFVLLPPIMPGEPNDVTLLKNILSSPIHGLGTLIGMVIKDSGHMLLSVWAGTFTWDKFIFYNSKIARIAWALGIAGAVIFGLYNRKSGQSEKPIEDHPFVQMLVLGVVAVLAGALPVWATDVRVAIGKWADRFTLGPMFGAVILVVFTLDWLFRTRAQKQWLFAILLASSIALQVTNTNQYRRDWVNQQNLYWQLSWRIPELKPGTAVIGSGTFTDKSSFYDAGYIIKLLFADQLGPVAKYDYFDIWHLPLSSYRPNMPLVHNHQKGGVFTGSTSQAIGMYFNTNNPNECVKILDRVYTADPNFNKGINHIIPISNPNLITVGDGSRVPDPGIFGTEPPHTWCYYFEKADLARQMKDWNTIMNLGAEAKAKGFYPASGGEYLPFIHAYAQTGEWAWAYELSLDAIKITPGLETTLCNNWSAFQLITAGTDRETYLAKAKAEFCSAATP
jgi:hypothetical protein